MNEFERVDQNMVLVMGLTGAGKTYFINKLTGQKLKEGKELRSCKCSSPPGIWRTLTKHKGTERCQILETSIGNTEFVIMDCPGFDDTTRSDAEILKEIAEQLSAVRLLGYNLKGIIYLHRITDNRMPGSAIRSLDLFKELIGENALSNVVLATTMWSEMKDIEKANERDSELREEYWDDMRRKGSATTRFDGTTASAEGIVSQLLGKKSVVLKIQEQLVDQKMSLRQTAAGAFLEPEIRTKEAQCRKRMIELEQDLEFEKNSNKRLAAKRSQKRNAASLQKKLDDRKKLDSKPGEEVETKLNRFQAGSKKHGLVVIQALAAVCTITFGIVGVVLGF